MGRWSHLDTDEERLSEGMTRVGYDADTQVYTYRDSDGSYWEGAPGAQYGKLFRVQSQKAPPLPSITIPDDVEGDEQDQVLQDYDDDDDDSPTTNNRHDEKSATSTTTSSRGVAEPKRAKVRRSHYQQHAGKPLPALPDDGNTNSSANEKDLAESTAISSDSDDDADSIQKENDFQITTTTTKNPVFAHRHKRTQDRQAKEQQQSDLKRSGTLSRIARYLSRAAGGNSSSSSSNDAAGLIKRRNTSTASGQQKNRTPRWPGASMNKAAVMSGEGLDVLGADGEGNREEREVEGVDMDSAIRRRTSGGGRSSRSSAASANGRRRGRAATFDEMLGHDGRLKRGGEWYTHQGY